MTYLILLLALLPFISGREIASLQGNKPNGRIIGGTTARAAQFPFAAAIHVAKGGEQFFCGGTLLTQEWIVTAGHCVEDALSFTVQLGSVSLNSRDPARRVYATSHYVLHPDFNSETFENNIGLIKLRISIELGTYIQPAFLPTASLLNYTSAMALGWGQTSDRESAISNDLKFVTVSVLPNEDCKLTYGDQITEKMVCAEGNYNEGTCNGDIGGPLVEYVNEGYWILGIATFLSGNGCESTDPSGFTRIYPYAAWIHDTIIEHISTTDASVY